MSEGSPFLKIASEHWVASNEYGFAIRDKFPVSPGHTLIIPKRLIPTWWEATPDEQLHLTELISVVKNQLDEEFKPDGYNVGFNGGHAAGQTVDHLHVHVIPRWFGDVDDPRGGVRGVIPAKRAYDGMRDLGALDGNSPTNQTNLINGSERHLRTELLNHLRDESLDRIDLVVSFVLLSGLKLLAGAIEDALDRGASIRILTTDYLAITEKAALGWLLDRMNPPNPKPNQGSLQVQIFRDPKVSFHPKSYIFWTSTGGSGVGFVGSSNLSASALAGGIEWNLRTEEVPILRTSFETLWSDERSVVLDAHFLNQYEQQDRAKAVSRLIDDEDFETIQPTPIQLEALAALEKARADGFGASMVVMATGLGKTWLSAFDSNRPEFQRVLFVAHREEILTQARDVFRRVRPDSSVGMFIGETKSPDSDIVFASVQSLTNHLSGFDPDRFDYVVIDEFHHAVAPSYRKVINHFRPKFQLGMTATPERLDGADLLALCHDNIAYECNLVEALGREALVPFKYWGVADSLDFAPIPWRNGRFDPSILEQGVITLERATNAIEEWELRKGQRTLAFCVSTRHADFMTEQFTKRGYRAASVHSGESSSPRHGSLAALDAGELDVICCVDMFNEGVDLPAVDTVLMLRPTQSPVVFLQQLGRGLRTAENKTHLRVVDFIGNHSSFLMKPRVLLGLTTGEVPSSASLYQAIASNDFKMPDGCSVELSLEAIDLLERFKSVPSQVDLLGDFCNSYIAEHGTRPTATQALRSGLDLSVARANGGWFQFLLDHNLLSDSEAHIVQSHAEFLKEVESTSATKSYKLVTLQALVQQGALGREIPTDELSDSAFQIVCGDPRLVQDVKSKNFPAPQEASTKQWRDHWRRWPLSALTGDLRGKSSTWFSTEERPDGEWFISKFNVNDNDTEIFNQLVAELTDYRMARYLATKGLELANG